MLDVYKDNLDLAIKRFFDELDPKTDSVIEGIYNIDNIYFLQMESNTKNFETLMVAIIVIIICAMIAIIIFSFLYGRKLANKIAMHIMMVAEWSRDLSFGAVDLDIDSNKLSEIEKENVDNEVGLMISAFHTMSNNIRENMEVVQRIADGDMTAFVKIRSRRDSLGKSLYRLVQSNDIMFNEIVDSAHSVASGADEIASTSHMLADSSTTQAAAAQSLSDEMKNISDLIHFNDEKAQSAYEVTEAIKVDLQTSNEHMKVLCDSVIHMRDASKEIATAMKTIDDITFETNILALNAAIEAACAGAVGKGFAVVAEEVRSLTQNSNVVSKEISTDLSKMQDYVTNVSEQFDFLNKEISEQNVKINAIKEVVKDINQIVKTIQTTMDTLLEQ